MTSYFWFAAAVWIIAACILVYGVFTEPERRGKDEKSYDEGTRDFNKERLEHEVLKRIGIGLLGLSMIVMWIENYFTK